MEIFGDIIKDEEIIGIGPLFAMPSKDEFSYQMYRKFRYEFEVHCKQRSVTITSDYFYPEGLNDEEAKKDRDRRNEWWDKYHKYREIIAQLFGESISANN